jgi:anti-anti-sigma factor
MDLSYRYSGKSVLIIDINEASGSLVNGTIEDFIETVLSMDRKKNTTVALDMSRKKYLNSSGLGDLIMTKDRLFDQGVDLVLIGVVENIRSLLSMVGVEDFFKMAGNETDL